MGPGPWLVLAPALWIVCLAQAADKVDTNQSLSKVFADTEFLSRDMIYMNQNISGADLERLISERVDDYVALVQRTLGLAQRDHTPSRSKRHLEALRRDSSGVYMLEGLWDRFNIPAKFPTDLALFTRLEGQGVLATYAVALEAEGPAPETRPASSMVLYKLKESRFLEVCRVSVRGAVDVEVAEIDGWMYVIAAESVAGRTGVPLEGSVLYRLNHEGNKLISVETIYAKNPSDLFFWEDLNGHFLGVACEFAIDGEEKRHSTDSLVYQWFGEHLDIIHRIPTHGAKRIIAFRIDSALFLAVANHINDNGETDIDSEIFKFNLEEKRWVSYQKIRTRGAMDIKFFSLPKHKGHDHFLVVANKFRRGVDGSKIYAANSVVYKWIEGYFIPFQSFSIHSAVAWMPYTGPRGELVMLAASEQFGLQVYQYDGWRFQEVALREVAFSAGRGIVSMRAYEFAGAGVVAISNSNNDGSHTNVFTLQFSHRNDLGLIHDNTLSWCQRKRERLTARSVDSLAARVRAAPKWTDPAVTVRGVVTFASNSSIGTFSAGALKSQTGVLDSGYVENLNSLRDELDASDREVATARGIMSQALKKNATNVVSGKVILKNAKIHCPGGCYFPSAHIGKLNNEDAGLFVRNTIRLDEALVSRSTLHFSEMTVPGNLNAKLVNSLAADALVNRRTTQVLSSPLLVNGLVTLSGDLQVDGTVDGARFKEDSVLLTGGDQTLQDYVRAEHWQVGNLSVLGRVSGMDLDLGRSELPPSVLSHWGGDRLDTLNVQSVQLANGVLHDVLLADLATKALRTTGPQQVTGLHTFSSMAVREVFADGPVGGVNFEKDVLRVDGRQVIPGAVTFSNPVTARHLQVLKRLNHVSVMRDGSMDLLLAHVNAAQVVYGQKTLRMLSVVQNARVHGRVLGLDTPPEDEPVVQVISTDVEIPGDVVVSGGVELRGGLVADDVVDASSGLSLRYVTQRGLRLDSTTIPHVTLGKAKAANVETAAVNGVRTASWVPDAPGAIVKMANMATFDGSVAVDVGSTLTGTVNGVNLAALDSQALKLTGDQVITGHKVFKSVTVTGAWSNDTLLGTARWRDIVAARRGENPAGQDGTGVTRVEYNLIVEGEVSVHKLRADGLVQGQRVLDMLRDSVFSDGGMYAVDGPKTFTKTFRVENLHVDGNVTGTDLRGLGELPTAPPEDSAERVYVLPANLTRPLSVRRLGFHGTLDGVTDEEWSREWLLTDGDQTLGGVQTVGGNVYANAGVNLGMGVNGVNLRKLSTAARINDPALSLGHVIFHDGAMVNGGVTTSGLVGGLDMSDVLLSRSTGPQEVRGRMILANGLDVEGKLHADGMVSGENFRHLCAFTRAGASEPQHITVNGNLHMEREMVIETVNGQSLSKLLNNTWLRDKLSLVVAEMEFASLNLTSHVWVEGRVDGVSLDGLAARYVSLSRDQTLTMPLEVKGGVVVESSLKAGSGVEVEGLVGNVALPAFKSRVMLDGEDQDIPAHLEFDTLHTTDDIRVDGLINGMDLANDVVRIDRLVNIVTESKTVESALVDDLSTDAGVRVQGVDLGAWNLTAVRTRGDYVVTGVKQLLEPHVASDMSVLGMANGVSFSADNILLRTGDQIVRGAKTVDLSASSKPFTAYNLQLRGLLNDINMRDFFSHLAFRTGDVNILSPVEIRAPLSASNVDVAKLYMGVNVTDLIREANNPPSLDQYREQHEMLQRTAERVQHSLRAQGYYLNYFHMAVSLRSRVLAVLPLSVVGDPAAAIAVIRAADPGTVHSVEFFRWDSRVGTIVSHPSLRAVSLPPSLRLVEAARWGGQSAIYWEADESGRPDVGMHLGHVMGLMRDGRLGLAQVLRDTRPSAWVSVVELGSLACLVRGSPGGHDGTDGFCSLHCAGTSQSDVVQQALPAVRPTHATALVVHGSPLVFVASASSERSEGSVDIWRWDGLRMQLALAQTLGVVNATAVAAVQYRGVHYLAAASGRVGDVPHTGMVHISRFDSASQNFTHWTSVDVEAPVSLEFAVLPSGELALYVVTECPTEGLVVLLYRGVAGFSRKCSAGAVPLGRTLSAFTTQDHQHVVALSGALGSRATLLQAAFKGSWEASERSLRMRG